MPTLAQPPLLEYWKPPSNTFVYNGSNGSDEDLKSPVRILQNEMAFRQLRDRGGAVQREMGGSVNIQMAQGPPPAYKVSEDDDDREPRWFDVQYWSKTRISLSVFGILIVIAIVVAVVVVEIRKNRYPDYSQLSYSKIDQCECALVVDIESQLTCLVSGTSFFDNFDYFSGYDPTSGFVHYLDSEQAAQSVSTIIYRQ